MAGRETITVKKPVTPGVTCWRNERGDDSGGLLTLFHPSFKPAFMHYQ